MALTICFWPKLSPSTLMIPILMTKDALIWKSRACRLCARTLLYAGTQPWRFRLFGQQRTAEKKAKNAERKERKGVRRTNRRTAAAVFRRQTRGFKSAAQTLRQAESCQKSIKKRVSRRPVSATSAFKALTMIAGKPPAKIRNERQSRENFRADIFPTLCRQKTSHIPNPA